MERKKFAGALKKDANGQHEGMPLATAHNFFADPILYSGTAAV